MEGYKKTILKGFPEGAFIVDEKKKKFWEAVGVAVVAVVAFLGYVFLGIKPKEKVVQNFTVKDDKTVITSSGQAVEVAPGQKAKDVVSAVTEPGKEAAPEEVKVTVKQEAPEPVPAVGPEAKSVGEMLFGPRDGGKA